MVRKEKKNFSRSKKFDEVKLIAKAKLQERSIQKKTGYERDIRTMMKTILEPVRAAEVGELEITREELITMKNRIEKLITRIRVLTINEGVNLSTISGRVQAEKNLIIDYIQGKRTLAGKVDQRSRNNQVQKRTPENIDYNEDEGEEEVSVTRKYGHEFDDSDDELIRSKNDYYRDLGFEDIEDEEEIDVSISKAQWSHAGIEKAEQQTEAFHRMCLNVIDSKISQIISEGIEHLMMLRKRRGKGEINYRDEIVMYLDDEILFVRHKTLDELRKKGYQEDQLVYFRDLYDKEFDINRTLMIRKCLYLSRVLEYRKGSTSTG